MSWPPGCERSSGPTELTYNSIKVDLRHHTVHVDKTLVTVTPTEFRLLSLFIREPCRTFSRDQIIDRVFGYDFEGFDRTVDAHVSNLRHKLEADPNRPTYIKTIYGVGYKFDDS